MVQLHRRFLTLEGGKKNVLFFFTFECQKKVYRDMSQISIMQKTYIYIYIIDFFSSQFHCLQKFQTLSFFLYV